MGPVRPPSRLRPPGEGRGGGGVGDLFIRARKKIHHLLHHHYHQQENNTPCDSVLDLLEVPAPDLLPSIGLHNQ